MQARRASRAEALRAAGEVCVDYTFRVARRRYVELGSKGTIRDDFTLRKPALEAPSTLAIDLVSYGDGWSYWDLPEHPAPSISYVCASAPPRGRHSAASCMCSYSATVAYKQAH